MARFDSVDADLGGWDAVQAFGIGVISQLALATTTTDGLAVRPIDSPTAFRDVALFWNQKDDGSPSLTAFIDAVISAPPPPVVQRLGD